MEAITLILLQNNHNLAVVLPSLIVQLQFSLEIDNSHLFSKDADSVFMTFYVLSANWIYSVKYLINPFPSFQLPDHLGSVRTICQGKGSQFVVGSTRNSILQGTFELNFQEIVTGHVDEVWALASHPSQNQFLTAGYDNLLHLWDTLTHRAVWSSNIGVSCKSGHMKAICHFVVIASK